MPNFQNLMIPNPQEQECRSAHRHVRRERRDLVPVHPAGPGELPDALVQVAALLRSGHYGTARRLRLEARGLQSRVDHVLLAGYERADDLGSKQGMILGIQTL